MEATSPKRQFDDAFAHHEAPLNLKGNQFLPTPSTSTVSSMADIMADARASPAPSDSGLSSIQDVSSIGSPTKRALACTASAQPPAKRRKLTPAEKNAKAAEKLRLDAEKAQKKAEKEEQKALDKEKKDAEKLKKDEEKRAKAEQREKEQAVKAAEKAKKDELKRQKEEEKAAKEAREQAEKLKKERSQLRLGAFLKAPVTITTTPGMSTPTKFPARARSLSLETFDDSSVRHAASPNPPQAQDVQPGPLEASEYKKFFLPFEVRPHMSLYTHSTHDDTAQSSFDHDVNSVSGEAFDLGLQQGVLPLSKMLGGTNRRFRPMTSVKQIHEATQTTGLDPTTHLAVELATHPVRYIHFCEDVRPAYVGTYTSIRSKRLARKARLNPVSRFRVDTNYDYDSEAEWEDPEEGEEIGNDEDDEESLGDADGMDEFLDDENDELAARRKTALSDLEAQSTGICWQDSNGKHNTSEENRRLLSSLRIQMLLSQSTIDPFSTSYWQATRASAVPIEPESRPVLAERSTNTPSKTPESAWPIKDKEGGKRGPKPGAQKIMTPAEFEEFKTVIVGSTKSKSDMIAELKETFPKLTAALVKDTLSEQFAYMGKTKADKKWKHVGTA